MKQLTKQETKQISGGFHLNLGHAVAALVVGFITGGPPGALIAVSGICISQGVNGLEEMYHNENGRRR